MTCLKFSQFCMISARSSEGRVVSEAGETTLAGGVEICSKVRNRDIRRRRGDCTYFPLSFFLCRLRLRLLLGWWHFESAKFVRECRPCVDGVEVDVDVEMLMGEKRRWFISAQDLYLKGETRKGR